MKTYERYRIVITDENKKYYSYQIAFYILEILKKENKLDMIGEEDLKIFYRRANDLLEICDISARIDINVLKDEMNMIENPREMMKSVYPPIIFIHTGKV